MSSDNVQVMYRVRHHYRYVYSGPIWDVKQRLLMIPTDRHGDQTLLSYDLEVRGTSGALSVEWQADDFQNPVCRIEAQRVERALDFEAHYTVSRGATLPESRRAEALEPYLSFTALTVPDARIRAAAHDIQAKASNVRAAADLAHDWAASAIAYRIGATGTQTPAAMALHLGLGVCQDFAHIMLALLRTLGIPARYVSGHLLGEGAPHAWVEVLLQTDTQQLTLAYDPTHHRLTNQNYITVAVGRDFADVTPTSGVFSGAAIGKLHWSKHAERIARAGSNKAADAAA